MNDSERDMNRAAILSDVRKPYDLATADHDFPEWEGQPQRIILICTHPRSGSTLLGEALYFAGGLGCPLEYFHAGFRPALERRWAAPMLTEFNAAVRRYRTDPGGTLSIKLFWRDIEDIAAEIDPRFDAFVNVLPKDAPKSYYRDLAEIIGGLFPNPELVHLWRDDRLRQAVSVSVAIDTGTWRSIPHVDNAPVAAPEFDYERIERAVAYSDYCHGHFRNLFVAMNATPHRLSYENLVADYVGSVRGVLDYFGSGADPAAPRMRRQADNISEAFVLRYLRERAGRGR